MIRTAPVGMLRLVVMRNNRRIEECRGFERVFRGQVGPDQHLAVVRAVIGLAGDFQGRPVVLVEHRGDAAVAGAELHEHVVQQTVNLFVAQGAHAVDDVADPLLPAGIEETGNDTAKITAEGDRQTADFQRADASYSIFRSQAQDPGQGRRSRCSPFNPTRGLEHPYAAANGNGNQLPPGRSRAPCRVARTPGRSLPPAAPGPGNGRGKCGGKDGVRSGSSARR